MKNYWIKALVFALCLFVAAEGYSIAAPLSNIPIFVDSLANLPTKIPQGQALAIVTDHSYALYYFNGSAWNASSSGGGGSGGYNIGLSPGLTNTAGTQNASPLSTTNTTLSLQTFPLQYTTSHAIVASEMSGALSLNSTTSMPWTIPQAGTTGFAIGNAVNLGNFGAGALNLTTTGSSFVGCPVTGSTLIIAQYGSVSLVADSNANWECFGNPGGASSGSGNLGTSVTVTSPSVTGDVTTGLYTAGANKVDIAITGVKAVEVTANATLNLAAAAGSLLINGANGISYPTSDSTAGASIAIGTSAMASLPGSAAWQTTAMGYQALGGGALTTAGIQNTAFGYQSLKSTTSGNGNAAFGRSTGNAITTGSGNTLVGNASGNSLTTGANNTYIGAVVGSQQGTGTNNTAVGFESLISNFGVSPINNSNNTTMGYLTGKNVTTGSSNVIIGSAVASTTLTTGSNNILIGTTSGTDTSGSATSNTINIGGTGGSWVLVTGTNTNSTEAITMRGVLTLTDIASDATHTDATVCEDTTTHTLYAGSGTLGVCLGTSSLRYKHTITPVIDGIAEISALKPVNYYYIKGRGDNGAKLQYGFLAEEVATVLPKLVGLDSKGEPNSVDILGMVPVLVKAVQELFVIEKINSAAIVCIIGYLVYLRTQKHRRKK